MFYIVQLSFEINDESLGLKIFTAVVCVISLLSYMYELLKMKKIKKVELFIYFISVSFLISSFYVTIKYGYIDDVFKGLILGFIARAIPSMLMGVTLARRNTIDKFSKWIQPLMLLFTFSLLSVIISNESGDMQNFGLLGLDRQLISYYSAFAFGMNVFQILNYDNIEKIGIFKCRIFKPLSYILFLIQIYGVFAGGGRGAIILLVLFLMYYLIKDAKQSNINIIYFIKLLLIIVFLTILIKYISSNDIIASGYNRIIGFFVGDKSLQDYNRQVLYSKAFNSFKAEPIFGHGIGSITYEINGYSHNIFLDLLVDGGFILLSFFMILLYKLLKYIKILNNENSNNIIIFVIFISSFVMLLFSGNYLSDSGIWFTLAYIFTAYKTERKIDGFENSSCRRLFRSKRRISN
jgi:O-antigen ligase